MYFSAGCGADGVSMPGLADVGGQSARVGGVRQWSRGSVRPTDHVPPAADGGGRGATRGAATHAGTVGPRVSSYRPLLLPPTTRLLHHRQPGQVRRVSLVFVL